VPNLPYSNTPQNLALHDYADNLADMGSSKQAQQLNIDALVASGDYFINLATNLDHLSQTLTKHKQPEHIPLEVLVNELLYLQRNYRIIKKL